VFDQTISSQEQHKILNEQKLISTRHHKPNEEKRSCFDSPQKSSSCLSLMKRLQQF
jgi:hypothetical protein